MDGVGRPRFAYVAVIFVLILLSSCSTRSAPRAPVELSGSHLIAQR